MNNKIINFQSKKTIIIAEGCDNHFGSLDNAKKMVINAKKAGADVIKFQHHLPDEEMLPDVPKSDNFNESLYEFLKKYSLSLKQHEIIKSYCKKKKIQYLCTPFSLKAARELNEIGVEWFKIGSGEFTDYPFIREVVKFGKPTILSTGMSSKKEILDIYNFLKNSTIVGHDVKYDYRVLKNELKKNNFILKNKFLCTLELMREFYPDLSSYKLKSLSKEFDIKLLKHHRAMDDAKATLELLKLCND